MQDLDLRRRRLILFTRSIILPSHSGPDMEAVCPVRLPLVSVVGGSIGYVLSYSQNR